MSSVRWVVADAEGMIVPESHSVGRSLLPWRQRNETTTSGTR